MVRLEELEDEHFLEKPAATKDDALLADDDDDYTDTDSEISSTSDLDTSAIDETVFERITALKDMIPPKARARISNVTSSVYNAANSGVSYGGKGLWVIATSILLLGLPYALAFGDEQQIQEEERQRSLMAEGAQGMVDMQGQGGQGQGDAKASL